MKFNIRINTRPEITQKAITVSIDDKLWNEWYQYQMFDNRVYDTDECQECGWISPEHLKSISEFNYHKLQTSS